MSRLPSFTFIVPVLNESARIDRCLQSIRNQDYPAELIEIDVSDQSSQDDTRERASRYNVKLTVNPPQRAIFVIPAACERSTTDLIAFVAADNPLDPSYCRKVAKAFEDPDVSAVFAQVTTDKPDYPLCVRYVNRFTDPFNQFIYGDASNPRDIPKRYQPLDVRDGYSLFRFSLDDPPMLSLAQGTVVRAPMKMDHAYPDDVGVVFDLISRGTLFAFMHEPLIDHYTASGLGNLLQKFRRIIAKNFAVNSSLRWRDRYVPRYRRIRRSLWPFYAVSIVGPIGVALWRTIRDREPLWLYHPIMTWGFAWVTATEALKRLPEAMDLLMGKTPPPDDVSVSRR